MATSKARRERRAGLQVKFASQSGGGYGNTNKGAKPATGTAPAMNPFMIPKRSGLTHYTNLYPDNYWVEWNPTTWRLACDQAQKMGYPVSYSALVNWCYEASTFVQSLFTKYGDGISRIPIYLVDEKGNKDELWTEEVCNKRWFLELRKEIVWANFWGFIGINFDPLGNQLYKYPQSQIDPINRLLRESTYNFGDGLSFKDVPNLLFVQHSTSYERFLGWMQPITRDFILMNRNSMNWVQAGARLAFPLLKVGYPANNNSLSDEGSLSSPFRDEAEAYAANVDPSKTLVSPYVLDKDGNRISAIDVDSKDPGSKQNAHKIYQEFNVDAKNDIRELVFGGTLTGNAGKFGTKGLGEVHEDMLASALEARNEECLSVLNDETDFLKKIRMFYKNFPPNLHFDTNRTKEYGIDEVVSLSTAIKDQGLRLTLKFFEKYGLDPEDIEEAPAPALPSFGKKEDDEDDDEKSDLSVKFEKTKRSLFGSKKKVYP